MSERAQTSETKIVRAAICPAIGIARVGNSESEYFLAPEVADPPPETPGFYRDPTGALKRQAVRFRVYGLNAAARPVAELTADNAEKFAGICIWPIGRAECRERVEPCRSIPVPRMAGIGAFRDPRITARECLLSADFGRSRDRYRTAGVGPQETFIATLADRRVDQEAALRVGLLRLDPDVTATMRSRRRIAPWSR